MYQYLPITDMYAREILDSRGNPTVEVEVLAGDRYYGRASVPAGASTGKFEAVELRDCTPRYRGLGVRKAVANINDKISREIMGMNVFEQGHLDHMLVELDGTKEKAHLGANALLGVSVAAAKAAANALGMPLFQYLGGAGAKRLPIPMMNIINGGRHAKNTLDFQEFMIMPAGAENFSHALQMGVEVYHGLATLLEKYGYSTAIGDEGGFAPELHDAEEALKFIVESIEKTGYTPGKDIGIAIDAAASEIFTEKEKNYLFTGEGKSYNHKVMRNTDEMIEYYEKLVRKYPIWSIEDPLHQEDWNGWQKMTKRLGDKLQIVGDDLFVTCSKRVKVGLEFQAANAVLIKMNQIGTLTETFETIELAKRNGMETIVSHRSGETSDTTIADLAVALNCGQIKTGAPCRGERIEKYNQLLRIEERLGNTVQYGN